MTKRQRETERLRATLEMHDFGIELARRRIKRSRPGATRAELERLFQRWLLDRPADAPGKPISWPRTSARHSRTR